MEIRRSGHDAQSRRLSGLRAMTQHVMASGLPGRHDRLMEFSANTDPITKLRFVLTANATTSGLAGLTALAAGERVDEWLATAHSGWVRVIGAGLVAFALAVIALSAPTSRISADGCRLSAWPTAAGSLHRSRPSSPAGTRAAVQPSSESSRPSSERSPSPRCDSCEPLRHPSHRHRGLPLRESLADERASRPSDDPGARRTPTRSIAGALPWVAGRFETSCSGALLGIEHGRCDRME